MFKTLVIGLLLCCNANTWSEETPKEKEPLPPHCFLAVKDLDPWLALSQSNHALDYGSGDGKLLDYLSKKGFITQGVDIEDNAVAKAHQNFPDLTFQHVEKNNLPFVDDYFDLVVSNFVLSDQKSKKDMINYLKEGQRVLNQNGIMIALVFSDEIYNKKNNWGEFKPLNDGDDEESASPTQILVHNQYTSNSFYWQDIDYDDAVKKAGLSICSVHSPIGSARDSYNWKDEKKKSPVSAMLISHDCTKIIKNAQKYVSANNYIRR